MTAKSGRFSLLKFLGCTYEHPHRIYNHFQNIPRRVAKFRENQLRDVEKSVHGKFF